MVFQLPPPGFDHAVRKVNVDLGKDPLDCIGFEPRGRTLSHAPNFDILFKFEVHYWIHHLCHLFLPGFPFLSILHLSLRLPMRSIKVR